MAYEVRTVQIQNPNDRDDYIVIAQSEFNPKIHRLFSQESPVLRDDPQPEEYPEAALVVEGLDITVAKLGVWLTQQTSASMLSRLMEQEPRRSAIALIKARIDTLTKA